MLEGKYIFRKDDVSGRDHYQGEYHGETVTGRGHLYYKDGKRYYGIMENGLRHGPGAMIEGDTILEQGFYVYDKYQQPRPKSTKESPSAPVPAPAVATHAAVKPPSVKAPPAPAPAPVPVPVPVQGHQRGSILDRMGEALNITRHSSKDDLKSLDAKPSSARSTSPPKKLVPPPLAGGSPGGSPGSPVSPAPAAPKAAPAPAGPPPSLVKPIGVEKNIESFLDEYAPSDAGEELQSDIDVVGAAMLRSNIPFALLDMAHPLCNDLSFSYATLLSPVISLSLLHRILICCIVILNVCFCGVLLFLIQVTSPPLRPRY